MKTKTDEDEADEERVRLKEWRKAEMDLARVRARLMERDEASRELVRKVLPGLLGDAYAFASQLRVEGDFRHITVRAEFIFTGCMLLDSSDEKLSELSAAILSSRLRKWRREIFAGQPVTSGDDDDAGDPDGTAYLKWLPGAPDETTKGANDVR
jgi:hypothetical protein